MTNDVGKNVVPRFVIDQDDDWDGYVAVFACHRRELEICGVERITNYSLRFDVQIRILRDDAVGDAFHDFI